MAAILPWPQCVDPLRTILFRETYMYLYFVIPSYWEYIHKYNLNQRWLRFGTPNFVTNFINLLNRGS